VKQANSATPEQLQQQYDAWNAQHPEGAQVSYESIISEGETHRGATRSEAQVLSKHSAVIWLKGKSGCVLLDHCTVIEPEEVCA
jgi:hypothetical protein